MHRLLLIGASIVVLAASVGALLAPHGASSSLGAAVPTGTSTQWLRVHRTRRTYVLHVPAGLTRRSPGVPLLLLLHGSNGDGDDMRTGSGMDSLADARGFIVAYPDGTRGVLGGISDWNAGNCCGPAATHNVDDVGFLRQLIGELERRLPIDRARVYVAGFSDGGRMTYRLGCELSRQIAGMAVASGSITTTRCRPARAIPLIAFHGTNDEEVAYDEPVPRSVWRDTPPLGDALPPAVQFWAAVDGCSALDSTRVAPLVLRTTFACARARVVFYRLDDASHGWPSGTPASAGDGAAMTQIDGAREIVRFLVGGG